MASLTTEIVVASCRAYSDAWAPMLCLLRRFWPDRWRTRLVTDSDGPAYVAKMDYDANHTPLGGDLGWCGNLLDFVQHRGDAMLLLMQEDFFIDGPVDSDFLREVAGIMEADPSIGCFRVLPCPGSDVSLPGERWGWIHPGRRYRISCQAAIWRADYLAKVLRAVLAVSTGTPADFEIHGMELCNQFPEKVASVNTGERPLPYIVSAISRGRWNPDAIRLCRRLGIPIDTTRRPIDDDGRPLVEAEPV